MYIVSGCLAGLKCRYDAEPTPDEEVLRLISEGRAIPVCPEQLGGLPSPRECCEIFGDKVLTSSGADVSKEFHSGAEQAVNLAKLAGVEKAILKQRSPSCGYGIIYDGTFTGKRISGEGVFAKKLKELGIQIKAK